MNTISKKNSVLLCATLWLATSLLYSCEQDSNEALQPGGVAASFTPYIAESATVETSPAESWELSRATDNRWSGDEIVGVAAFEATSGTQYTTKYHQYIPNGGASGTRVQLVPATGESAIYYPADGEKLTFTAFAPYPTQDDIDNGYSTLGSNMAIYQLHEQSTEENIMERLDFIFHQGTTAYSQEAPVAALNFRHKLSRVIINLTRGSNYPGSLAGTVASIADVPSTAMCNIVTGEVTAVGYANALTPFRSTSGTAQATFQAIMAPQTSASGVPATSRTLTFAVNGTDYTIDIPQDWESGKSYTYDFVLDISGLTLAGSTVVNWGPGTVAWDQVGNVLTAPTKVTHYKAASTSNTIIITTTSTDTPVVSYSTSATNITGSTTVTAYLTQTAFTRTKATTPYEWTLTYNLTENGTLTNRVGYIWISLGAMTAVIELTQGTSHEPDGLANCYIVAPGTSITIPLSRAVTYGGASASTGFTATKLWDDTTGGAVANVSTPTGTGVNATMTVTAGANPGNALIAVRQGSTTYWSYHIWVTEYNPNSGATYTNAYTHNGVDYSFTFMDRNLGATFAGLGTGIGTGLFYQWGRKDPFPATLNAGDPQPGSGAFTTNATSASVGTVEYTLRNPDVFIYDSGDQNETDWHYGSRNNELWGHSGGKTIYDPCPAGWRVPVNHNPDTGYASNETSPWTGMVFGTTAIWSMTSPIGITWNNTALYPACNGRGGNSATAAVVQLLGRYWSASPYAPSSPYVSSTYFFSEGVEVNIYYMGRARGYSLRCVRE